MAARPRKREYRHLPEYLVFDKDRGVYKFTLITGKKKNIGKDRATAIAIAREYNIRMRPESAPSLDSLIRESGGINGESKPFSEHAQNILERAIRDEKPSKGTLAMWLNDIVRIKEYFSDIPACDIELEHVNNYLKKYHGEASVAVQNRKVIFLKKLFSYAVDESLMHDNPAARKKMRRIDPKMRQRLKLDQFIAIRDAAEPWLRTAMDLSLQTAQARLEVSRIRYSIKEPKEGICGCVWFDNEINGVFGTLYIHRQKIKDKEASHVAIPIGSILKDIIEGSRDSIASPYVVHRLHKKKGRPVSKHVNHPTQVVPGYLSEAFSTTRDRLGICADLPMMARPTFHEIRALAAHLFEKQGVDPQARMAHSDAKSTKVYTQNHVQWVEVPHAEIDYKTG